MSSLFARIQRDRGSVDYRVIVSIAEIYQERINDLLEPRKENLQIVRDRHRGMVINDVSEYLCSDEHEVFQLIDIGNKNRAIGCNRMNQKSSRSHTIVTISVILTN